MIISYSAATAQDELIRQPQHLRERPACRRAARPPAADGSISKRRGGDNPYRPHPIGSLSPPLALRGGTRRQQETSQVCARRAHRVEVIRAGSSGLAHWGGRAGAGHTRLLHLSPYIIFRQWLVFEEAGSPAAPAHPPAGAAGRRSRPARQVGATAGRDSLPGLLLIVFQYFGLFLPIADGRPGNGWGAEGDDISSIDVGVAGAGPGRTPADELRFRNVESASASFLIQIIEPGTIYIGNSDLCCALPNSIFHGWLQEFS